MPDKCLGCFVSRQKQRQGKADSAATEKYGEKLRVMPTETLIDQPTAESMRQNIIAAGFKL